jgi:hypothetical protein
MSDITFDDIKRAPNVSPLGIVDEFMVVLPPVVGYLLKEGEVAEREEELVALHFEAVTPAAAEAVVEQFNLNEQPFSPVRAVQLWGASTVRVLVERV